MLAAHRNGMTSGEYVFISLGLLPPDNVLHDMTSGEYVFISLGLLPPDNVLQPWLRRDDDDDEAANAYFALLQVLKSTALARFYFAKIAVADLRLGSNSLQRTCMQRRQ